MNNIFYNIDVSNNGNISNNDNISPKIAVSTTKKFSNKNDVSNNLISQKKPYSSSDIISSDIISSDIISSDVEDSDNVIEVYEQSDNISDPLEYMRLTNLLHVNQNKINVLEDFQEENQILKNKINELEKRDDTDKKHINSLISVNLQQLDPFQLLLTLYMILKEIKEKLKELTVNVGKYQYELELGTQDKDDLIFYKSIILDSKKYYTNAFRIREIKLIYDLNQIVKMFNDRKLPEVFDLNKNIISLLKTHYNKVSNEIENNNKKNTKPTWIKNNKLKYIENIKTEMNRIFLYHIDINSHFKSALIKEIRFYTS